MAQDPQMTKFDDWVDSAEDLWPSKRIDQMEVARIIEQVNADHPALGLEVSFGDLGETEWSGEYVHSEGLIILSDAVDDAEFQMSMGRTTLDIEALETYCPLAVLGLVARALFAHRQESRRVEKHGPEFVGAYCYTLARYAGWLRDPSVRVVQLAESAGLRVAPFLAA